MAVEKKIALTGFMGVGKSSVARHLASRLRVDRLDLDYVIEKNDCRRIATIIDDEGIDAYRRIETDNLRSVLKTSKASILSLGGGTFTVDANRAMLRDSGFTSVWLGATFEHCWRNISKSKKDRPLARDREKALQLFNDRQTVYCLADWHFIIKPGLTSYDIACEIIDEIF
jgi:shikimate kinase